jgi:tetratricopeptide (TPR) repeat protein
MQSLAQNNLGVTAAHWERARALLPNFLFTSPDTIEVLLELRRYDEAEMVMRERGKRFPRDTDHLIGLARVAERRGDLEDAVTRWKLVSRRVANTSEGNLGCARCLIGLDRLREAERHYNAALWLDSYNLDACRGLAMISDRRKDWTESLVRWKHVSDTFGFAPAFAHYARVLVQLDRVDEAETYLRKPCLDYPGNLEIAETQSHIAERLGDLVGACNRWAKVRAIAPQFPGGYVDGARCLARSERHEEADAVLESAIERFPDVSWPSAYFARLAHDRQDWHEASRRWEALRLRFPDEDIGREMGIKALTAAGRESETASLNDRP